MKRKIVSGITLTLLLLAIAIGVAATPWDGVPDDPTPAQAIWVDPKITTCFDRGDTFVVDVLINITSPTEPGGGTGLFGFEYKLSWDPNVIDITGNTTHIPPGWSGMLVADDWTVPGRHWYAYTNMYTPDTFTGVTSLCTYTFEVVVGDGSSDLNIYDEELADDTGTPTTHTTVDGYVTIPNFCIIRADGSVFPPTAPISNFNNIIYTLTRNINKSIVVERDNIVVDGAGYTLQGTGNRTGIDLSDRSNVEIKNFEIEKFSYGIYLNDSASNSMLGNNIIANELDGIVLYGSSKNTIANNILINNHDGIRLYESSNNSVAGNNIANNYYGIFLAISSNNSIHGNNITANDGQGIWLGHSSSNSIYGNNIKGNSDGIELGSSSNNSVHGNSIAANLDDGIYLSISSNNNISANNITNNNGIGIGVWYSSNNRIYGNNIKDNSDGIELGSSSNNSVHGNSIAANLDDGIWLGYSSNNNSIHGNIIANNWKGIMLTESSNNSIYHNNFVDNNEQAAIYESTNMWDDGYPSGGNYWGDHNPPDVYCGPYQNETGKDRIGDTPYVIDEDNMDRYTLIYPYGFVPSIDLTDDGKITITDIVICALAFDSRPGDPEWNPIADLNQDEKITITDIVMIALHFGETW